MASENASWVNRLKTLFTPKSGKESQGEAGKIIPAATYGESFIKKSFKTWKDIVTLDKFRKEYMGTYSVKSSSFFTFKENTNDCVVEVFVTPTTERIKKPYDRGVAYELCKLDRWYAPDCRPGIISWIVQPNNPQVYARRETLIVLFAEDQYIELRPEARKITDPKTLRLCQLHFEERGFDFLDENQTLMPFDLFDYQKEAYNGVSGQAAKEVGIGSDWTYRGGVPNPQIAPGGTSNINNRQIPQVNIKSVNWDPGCSEWSSSETITYR